MFNAISNHSSESEWNACIFTRLITCTSACRSSQKANNARQTISDKTRGNLRNASTIRAETQQLRKKSKARKTKIILEACPQCVKYVQLLQLQQNFVSKALRSSTSAHLAVISGLSNKKHLLERRQNESPSHSR